MSYSPKLMFAASRIYRPSVYSIARAIPIRRALHRLPANSEAEYSKSASWQEQQRDPLGQSSIRVGLRFEDSSLPILALNP